MAKYIGKIFDFLEKYPGFYLILWLIFVMLLGSNGIFLTRVEDGI